MTNSLRIGFGSCNKPRNSQEIFESMKKSGMDTFIWLGDVVYAKHNELTSLIEAYEHENIKDLNSKMNLFLKGLKLSPAIGIWDDHDLGVNDGGANVDHLQQRQALFRQFIGTSDKDESHLYTSKVFKKEGSSSSVKVILLDTRSERDDYVIPSVGHIGSGKLYGGLFFPLLASCTRFFSAYTGLTLYHNEERRMLSLKQWEWFESELFNKNDVDDSSLTIIGSSIQVTTANPLFESWGHFPFEQKRLLSLLRKFEARNQNKSVLLISGDVHMGEILSSHEVTSSGLTHTCTDGGIPRFICEFTINLFALKNSRQYGKRNFGIIEVDFETNSFSTQIRDIEGNPTISLNRTFGDKVFTSMDIDHIGIVPSTKYRVLFMLSLTLSMIAGITIMVFIILHYIRIRKNKKKPKND